MINHDDKLEKRRHMLIARCEVQRVELIQRSQELQAVLSAIDSTVHAVQRIKQHPGLLLGALGAVLLIIRPRRIGNAMSGLSTAARTWNMLAPMVHGLRHPRLEAK